MVVTPVDTIDPVVPVVGTPVVGSFVVPVVPVVPVDPVVATPVVGSFVVPVDPVDPVVTNGHTTPVQLLPSIVPLPPKHMDVDNTKHVE